MKNNESITKTKLELLTNVNPDKEWIENVSLKLKKLEDVTNLTTPKYRLIDILNFSYLSMSGKKRMFNVAFGLFIALFISAFGYFIFEKKVLEHNPIYLSGEEKDMVLEEIVKNNPLLIQEESDTIPTEFNYYYMKATWSTGSKYQECKISSPDDYHYFGEVQNSTFEKWSYLTDTIDIFSTSKWINKDSDGVIKSISINDNTSQNKNISYYYEGGDYATRQVTTNIPDFGPIEDYVVGGGDSDGINDSLVDYEAFIKSYYLDIPDIINTDDGNYIIEYSFTVDCDQEYGYSLTARGSDRKSNTIIVRDYISKENYQITREEQYLDKIDSKHLLMEVNYEYELSTVTVGEIASNFEIPNDFPIKDLPQKSFHEDNIPTKEELFSDMMNIIKTNNIPIINPSDKNMQTSIQTSDDVYNYTDYVTDINFYSKEDYGQVLYNELMGYIEQAEYSRFLISVYTTPAQGLSPDPDNIDYAFVSLNTFNFSYYDDSIDLMELMDAQDGELGNPRKLLSEETKKIQMGDNEIEIIILKQEEEQQNPDDEFYNGGNVAPDSELYDCKEQTCKFAATFLIIKLDNGFYTVNHLFPMRTEEIDAFFNQKFEILEPSKVEDMKKIEQLIQEMFKRYAESPV